MKVNKELQDKVKANGGYCLCHIKQKCPCPDFIQKKVCKCGVYLDE
ncbi:MAG: hypothetical protein WC307_06160 [Candidatus Nanoarchaeia archaeon]